MGFIAGVLIDETLIEFTTYNGSKLLKSSIDNEKVELILENKKFRLNITALRKKATELASPIMGYMDGRIEESLTSEIEVMLFDKKNKKIILNDIGKNSGLEVAGKVEELNFNQQVLKKNSIFAP